MAESKSKTKIKALCHADGGFTGTAVLWGVLFTEKDGEFYAELDDKKAAQAMIDCGRCEAV